MRIADLAGGLILSACALVLPAAGFEVEGERRFGPPVATETVAVLSTTDAGIAAPLVEGFLRGRPGLAVRYVVASSQEVHRAIAAEGAAFDIVISSAMDLQLKRANDGFAQAHRSVAVDALPDWAHWRDRLFGFAPEPAVLLVSRRAFEGLPLPQTRRELVAVLRENPDRFRGRVATYDPRTSGAGYLFAMQDSRQSEAFWRLAEVMGRLDARLYCCSSAMIAGLAAGRIAVAYNVVGSYAAAHARHLPDATVIEPQDFTVALLRTALIPVGAARPDLGGALLDLLVSPEGQALSRGDTGFPPLDQGAIQLSAPIRPIRLDPGLLVNLDAMTRRNFLREWDAAMTQH